MPIIIPINGINSKLIPNNTKIVISIPNIFIKTYFGGPGGNRTRVLKVFDPAELQLLVLIAHA